MEKKASEVISKCILEGDDVLGALSGLFERKIRNIEKRHSKCAQLLDLMNSGEKLNDDQKACALVTRDLEHILDFLKEVLSGISSLTGKESGKLGNGHGDGSCEIKENGSVERRGPVGGFLEFVNKLKLVSYNVEELKKSENLKKIALTIEEIDNLVGLYNLVKPKDNCDTHARISRIETIYDNFRKSSSVLVGYPVEGSYACVKESYQKIDESLKKIKVKRSLKVEKPVLPPLFNETTEEFVSVVDRVISPLVDLKIAQTSHKITTVPEIVQIVKASPDPNLIKIEAIGKMIQNAKIPEKTKIASTDEFTEGFLEENKNSIGETKKKPQRNNYRREMGNNGRWKRNDQNFHQNHQQNDQNLDNAKNIENPQEKSENLENHKNRHQNQRNYQNRQGNRYNSRQNNRQNRSNDQNYQNNENFENRQNYQNPAGSDNIHVVNDENNVVNEVQPNKTFERKFNRQSGNRTENRGENSRDFGKRRFNSNPRALPENNRKSENSRMPNQVPGQKLESNSGPVGTNRVPEPMKTQELKKKPESPPVRNGAMKKAPIKVVISDVPKSLESQTYHKTPNSSGKTSVSVKSTL